MLPPPVSFTTRSFQHRTLSVAARRRKLINVILSRSRVTNLGLILLSAFTALSVLLNLSFYYATNLKVTPIIQHSSYLWTPLSILSTISRDGAVQRLDHLIIVPGHAIWKGPTSDSRLDEDEWVLEPFQKGGGRVSAFISHIERG